VHHAATQCNTTATHYNLLQDAATSCCTLRHTATLLKRTAILLQHTKWQIRVLCQVTLTATHCNMLQHAYTTHATQLQHNTHQMVGMSALASVNVCNALQHNANSTLQNTLKTTATH